MTTHQEELLPCPFCGGKARIEVDEDNYYQVGCFQAGRCGAKFTHFDYEADATATWNRRTTLAPVNAEPVGWQRQLPNGEWSDNFRRDAGAPAEWKDWGFDSRPLYAALAAVNAEPVGCIDRHKQKFASKDTHSLSMLIESGWAPVYAAPQASAPVAVWELECPVPNCEFHIGQAVKLANPYAEQDPDTIYYVAGITWEHRMVAARGWNISIATKEEIERGYGQTDGFTPDDLLPARSAPVEGQWEVSGPDPANQMSGYRFELLARSALVEGGEAIGAWRDMSIAPKDGTMLRLLVQPGSADTDGWTPFADSSGPYQTIGFNALSDTMEDEWQFAGWDWCHDCFTDGAGEVIGWLPFVSASAPGAAAPSGCAFNNDHLAWACERWQREVANRPLRNVHRRTLDDTWRQVIRRLGGDPAILLPMTDHDTLVAENPDAALATPAPADERVVEALPHDLFTHRDAWRTAIEAARDTAEVTPPDIDDRSYWQHELDVFDRVFAAIAATEGRKNG